HGVGLLRRTRGRRAGGAVHSPRDAGGARGAVEGHGPRRAERAEGTGEAMNGYITFRLAARELACRLDEVREVVRLVGLESLPGMAPPVSGVLELRGNPLPVIDLR